MLFDEFMQRVLLLFPEAELGMDADKQITISTGWFQDPDETEHVYTDGEESEVFKMLGDGALVAPVRLQ